MNDEENEKSFEEIEIKRKNRKKQTKEIVLKELNEKKNNVKKKDKNIITKKKIDVEIPTDLQIGELTKNKKQKKKHENKTENDEIQNSKNSSVEVEGIINL